MNEVKLRGLLNNSILYVERNSGYIDSIPLYIYNKTYNKKELKPWVHPNFTSKYVEITGKVGTVMTNDTVKKKTFVIPDMVIPTMDLTPQNIVTLEGYIVQKNKPRATPYSNKRILDFLLAINDPSGEAYYFNCIAWESVCDRIHNIDIGKKVQIEARFQSREYQKQIHTEISTVYENRTTYELSVRAVKVV